MWLHCRQHSSLRCRPCHRPCAGRLGLYLHSSVDTLSRGTAAFTDSLLDTLGAAAPLTVSSPLAGALQGVLILALFLSQVGRAGE